MQRHSNPVRKTRRNGRTIFGIKFWYTDLEGRRRRFRRDASVQTATSAQAEAKRLVELAARTGSPFAPAELPTFEEFVDGEFLLRVWPTFRASVHIRYSDLLRQGIRKYFGPMPLDAVDFSAVMNYAASLRARGVDPRGAGNLVRSIIRSAVDLGTLPSMPKMPSFPQPETLPDAPSMEEARVLFEAATGWLKVAIGLALFAGLRQGEVRAFQVGEVDFDDNLIYVRQTFSGSELFPPKGIRERVLPVAPELRDLLQEVCAGKARDAFIVMTSNGNVPSRQAVLYALKGLEQRCGCEPWSFHSLRHCFCSELVRRGVNVEVVRALAGHARLSTTQRYLHATDPDKRAAIAKLGGN